jgi:hypothetical protein
MAPSGSYPFGTSKAARTAAASEKMPKKSAPSPSSTTASNRFSAAIAASVSQNGTGHRSSASPSPVAALSGSE